MIDSLLQPHENAAVAAAVESGLASTPAPSAIQRAANLVLWRNPVLTAVVFGTGLATLTAIEFLLRGDHQMTLLSGEDLMHPKIHKCRFRVC